MVLLLAPFYEAAIKGPRNLTDELHAEVAT